MSWSYFDLGDELRAAFDSGGLNQICPMCGCIEPASRECPRCGADSDPDLWHWRGDLEQ